MFVNKYTLVLGTYLLTTYGWYIFAIILVIAYYWESIQLYFERRHKEHSDKEYEAKCKKGMYGMLIVILFKLELNRYLVDKEIQCLHY